MPSLARLHNFVAGDIIRASEWVDELTQLYNYLSGIQSGQLVLINDFARDVLFVKSAAAMSSRNIIEFRKNDLPLVRINDRGQYISLTESVAPFDVVSTTKVVGLNAEFLDDRPLTDFLLVGQKVETFLTFMFPGVNVTGQKSATYIVPAGTNMQLETFNVSSSVRNGVYPGGDVDFTVVLRKNGVSISSLFCIGSTWANSSSFTSTLAENDLVTVTIDNVDLHGEIEGPREICATVKLQQDLVA